MKATIDFAYDREKDPDHLICRIECGDASLHGTEAELTIQAHCDVVVANGIDSRADAYSQSIRIETATTETLIPFAALRAYPYFGTKLKISQTARLKVDGETIEKSIDNRNLFGMESKSRVVGDSNDLVEPADYFSLTKNVRAVPLANKIKFFGLAVVGGIVILVNSILGLHDEMAPESQTYFYGKRDSDGDRKSPLVNSLIGSGSLGVAVWFAMRHQLRGYMKLQLKPLPSVVDSSTSISIRDLIHGVSRVPLDRSTLRVVACNLECGQYVRGSGTKKRTVSFKEPFNAVVLYERKNVTFPPGVPVESCISGDVDFGKMFGSLYPEYMVSSSHGIGLQWEIQLLHDDFVDQEIIGPNEPLAFAAFQSLGRRTARSDSAGNAGEADFFAN
jgi:hypothetical protein